jgi:GT2 family glycosyltransferase/glycosyltransferase involved in cell wall biosynthesis
VNGRQSLPTDPGPLPAADRGTTGAARVCIASADLVGPVRNGGVGTAFSALATALADAGHEVTLLYLGGDFCENGRLSDWIEHYRRRGIEFVPLPLPELPRLQAPFHVARSQQTYEWLKRNDRFDVIHFSEWLGHGYFSLLARRQGLCFADSLLCVDTHGPSLWHKMNNADLIHLTDDVELDFMERQSVALADVLLSPSRYLVRWMREQHWTLPEQVFVQPYVMPDAARRRPAPEGRPRSVQELVFFGRLEVRKGLILFCDALDRLAAQDPPATRLTFLGKAALVEGRPADEYVRSRAKAWPWEPKVVSDLDQAGVMRYLGQPGRLALVPSLADNLPNTVLECLGGGIPFLAANTGGIPEMIAAADLGRTCFEPDAEAFAERLRRALHEGHGPSGAAVDAEANERAWVAWHASAAPAPAGEPAIARGGAEPLVSIVMPHHDRPRYLAQALESIRAQDYPSFELILVDDGSTTAEALDYLRGLEPEFERAGWRLLRQPNRYPGAARNHGARSARGEYLFFMDDDNYARPHELRTLVGAARRSGADVLTCFSDVVTTAEPIRPDQPSTLRWLFLGGPAAAGPFRNVFGDTNALVRRSVFHDLGGFHEKRGVGMEDWELWARAVLRGYKLMVVPEALFWYRSAGDGVNTRTPLHANLMQVLEPYREATPEPLHALLELAQGMRLANEQLWLAVNRLQEMQGSRDELNGLLGAARTLTDRGDLGTACRVYAAGIQLARERDDTEGTLESLLGTAEVLVSLNQRESARESLVTAEKLARRIGNPEVLERVRSCLDGVRGAAPVGAR